MAARVDVTIGGTWTDITDDVKVVGQGITIAGGASDEQSLVTAGKCGLVLDDSDGRYNDHSPMSPYYGRLGRNTPIRVVTAHPTAVTPAIRSTSNATFINATKVTVAKPAGATAGDLLVFLLGCSQARHEDISTDFDCRTLRSAGTLNPSGQPRVATKVYSRWVGSGELTTYTFSGIFGGSGGVFCYCLQNVGYGEVVASTFDNSTSDETTIGASYTTPSMTPLTSTDLDIRFVIANSVDGAAFPAWTPPAGYTERWDTAPSGTTTLTTASRVLAASTATGTQVWTLGDPNYEYGHGIAVLVSTAVAQFHGEVPSWAPRPHANSGEVIRRTVTAAGILQRLTTGQSDTASPMLREALKDPARPYAAAYWPCEDASDARSLAQGLSFGQSMRLIGEVSPGQTSTIPGSSAMVQLGSDGVIAGRVPSWVDTTGKIFFRVNWEVPATPSTPNGWEIINIYCSGGNIQRIAVAYLTSGGGSLVARATTDNGTVLDSTQFNGGGPTGFNGQRGYVSLEFVQDGSNVNFLFGNNILSEDDRGVASFILTDTWTGVTTGRATVVTLGSQMDQWKVCHIGVGNRQTFMFSMTQALTGFWGERAAVRAMRIAAEASIPLQVVGDPTTSAPMGAQVPGSALEVIRSCEAAGQDILTESTNELGLTYICRSALYAQPTLTVPYALLSAVDPVDDDQGIANDVTVSRIGGSSRHAELQSGAMSTQDWPNGIGRYISKPPAVGIATEAELAKVAGWLLHLGTSNAPRLRILGIQPTTHPALVANPALAAALISLGVAAQFALADTPPWLSFDPLPQVIRGYTKTLDRAFPGEVDIAWTTAPGGPYLAVGQVGKRRVGGRDDMRLTSPVTLSATSLVVASDSGHQRWATTGDDAQSAADFPIDAYLRRVGQFAGGERVTVTAATALSGGTQTLTVVRAVNGVARSWAAGTVVEVAEPAYVAW